MGAHSGDIAPAHQRGAGQTVNTCFVHTTACTKISSDASAYGLEAVLLQQHEDDWKPVAFASTSMTDTERHYSQIEKEALALVWAYEKFQDYILGKYINFETDHKPLGQLMSTTSSDSLPPRVLRFRLCLMRFSCSICHIASKYLYTADTCHVPLFPIQMQQTC